MWGAEQESQGNDAQEHLSYVHVAVAEPVAERLGLPGVEGTAPADQLGMVEALEGQEEAVQEGLGVGEAGGA